MATVLVRKVSLEIRIRPGIGRSREVESTRIDRQNSSSLVQRK